MSKNRSKVEKTLYNMLDRLTTTKRNSKIYKDIFKGMSDKQFDDWMEKLNSGTIRLCVFIEPDGKENISVEAGLKIADEIGHEFFDYMIVDTGEHTYKSPVKVMSLLLTVRRVGQRLDKKMAAAYDSKSVDQMTGQPSGKSAAGAVSFPEVQIMRGLGQEACIDEIENSRGGDELARRYFVSSLMNDGSVRLNDDFKSGVVSKKVLGTWYIGRHIGNNL